MVVILTQTVNYENIDGESKSIPAGELVYVDEAKGIAFYNDEHFVIERSEYAKAA